jgi:SAM-dependent methyltransferase
MHIQAVDQDMYKINSITIDSTNSTTDLCLLGVKYPTDKSPYNIDTSLHKHPYTSIYNLLFSNLRYKNIKLGEVGILDNNSMLCWREYFTNAELYGFEYFDSRLEKAINDNIECKYIKMDIKNVHSISEGLSFAGSNFDILIDDSTHEFKDQIKFINEGHKHLKTGGILIVEDIFIDAYEQDYANAINLEHFSSATFINANHNLKNSEGWNNDKLLVLYKNDIPCS